MSLSLSASLARCEGGNILKNFGRESPEYTFTTIIIALFAFTIVFTFPGVAFVARMSIHWCGAPAGGGRSSAPLTRPPEAGWCSAPRRPLSLCAFARLRVGFCSRTDCGAGTGLRR